MGKHTKPHPITEDFAIHEQMAKDLDFYGFPDYATLIRRLSNAIKFKNAEIDQIKTDKEYERIGV